MKFIKRFLDASSEIGQYVSCPCVCMNDEEDGKVLFADNNSDDEGLTKIIETNKATMPLCFKAKEDSSIKINDISTNKSILYSIDKCETWNDYTLGTDISVGKGNTIYFKSDDVSKMGDIEETLDYFIIDGSMNQSGSILSLFNNADYDEIINDGLDASLVTNVFTGPYYYETQVIKDYYESLDTSVLQDSSTTLQSTGEDIFNWVFKTVINKLTNSTLPGQIYDILIKGNQPNYLQEILDTLSTINSKIEELSKKTTMFKYEDVINSRNNYVSKMNNAQLETNTKLSSIDSTLSDDEKDAKVKEIVVNWAEKVTIDGNSSLVHYMNFIDFIVDNVNDGMTLYDIYDKYVYYTTPWENMGYQFREDIRTADFSIIFAQARLAILYYEYTETDETVKTNLINNIITALKKYETYYNNHVVVRHEDVAICQISGVKMEISKNLIYRYYKDMTWLPKGTYWYIPDYQTDCGHIPELSGTIYDLVYGPSALKSTLYHSTFTDNDMNVFKQYYNGKYTCLKDMLEKDAGIHIDVWKANGYIILQGEPYRKSESWNNGNWYINCRAVKMTSNFDPGWYTIGDAWLERYGFMWCKQRYEGWDTYYDDNTWYLIHINKRLE